MGFRDLRLFNLAMLGKQGWRLIIRTDSLCARVLKGRYFHDSDFMRATRKRHASRTWRAILAGREALQHGLIRRIADGESTDIWNDRWIANYFDGRPVTSRVDQVVERVADLITEDGQWDETIIKASFLDIDERAIVRQPLNSQGQDFWAWEPERSGIYTVKSAYKLLFKKKEEADHAQGPSSSADGLWSKIWKLEIPPKVKVFWWRVAHEFLPARQVLWKRHIEPVPCCEVCGASEESIAHVLLHCTIVKVFWSQIRAGIGVKLPDLNPITWVNDLTAGVCSRRETAVILCGMWSLWMRRNSRRHGELQIHIQ